MGNKLELLSRDDLDRIHDATLNVLRNTGARFLYDKALKVLDANGCEVDWKTKIVRFPEELVKECIAKAQGQHATKYDTRQTPDLVEMPKQDVYFRPFGQGVRITDRDGTTRSSTLRDIKNVVIIGDALESLDVVSTMVYASDMPRWTAGLHSTEVLMTRGDCPVDPVIQPAGYTPVEETEEEKARRRTRVREYRLEMACAYYGMDVDELRKRASREIMSAGGCPNSPLTHASEILEGQMWAAERGFPSGGLSQAMTGATAPITLPGTMVVHNAELISLITLLQLIQPGLPCRHSSSTCTIDMRKGYCTVGTPEMGLISAMAMQLAQYYDLDCTVAGA
ncbi:MAG: trimethylamine methyltransferase family protein [Candidatus Bathyarchaeota archaeon]|nr:MAG: trimethylamine methyltransferase family protein [Candidatus Bathyarchaeota archaeon]